MHCSDLQVRETWDLCAAVARRSMDEITQSTEVYGLAAGLPMHAIFARMVLPDQSEAVAQLMHEYRLLLRAHISALSLVSLSLSHTHLNNWAHHTIRDCTARVHWT
jgi:hypothetical protein